MLSFLAFSPLSLRPAPAQVEPRSGPGWDNFGLRSVGFAGQLFARRSLDYELEAHRRGFRFRVQVTDQVRLVGRYYGIFCCFSCQIFQKINKEGSRGQVSVSLSSWCSSGVGSPPGS